MCVDTLYKGDDDDDNSNSNNNNNNNNNLFSDLRYVLFSDVPAHTSFTALLPSLT
jgi:hypothetical protein